MNFILLSLLIVFPHFFPIFAGPQSTTYELKEYGFGSGGLSGVDSATYSLFGTVGEIDASKLNSSTYTVNGGLIFTIQAAVPPAPTVNSNSNYDRLQIILQTGNNPSDAKYAIAITDDNWTTTKYVQSDYTVGTTLGNEDWLTYSGAQGVGWGGAGGFYVTGLKSNTTYKIKVKAKQGKFTETQYGPATTQTTSVPSLAFGIDSAAITFANLNAGNGFTDSSKTTVLTTSTNAYNGYIVYGYETQPLTHTANGSYTIANYPSGNSAPSTWSGTGFGYTTNDSSLTGGTANRFTNGGPKYAGFTITSPGDPVADHAGPVLTPVSNEQFTVGYRVTTQSSTNAGQYKTTILYIIVPTY